METVVSHVFDKALSCRGREDRQTLNVVKGLEIADIIRVELGSLEVHVAFGALCLHYIFVYFLIVSAVRSIARKAFVPADETDRYEGSCKHLYHHCYCKESL